MCLGLYVNSVLDAKLPLGCSQNPCKAENRDGNNRREWSRGEEEEMEVGGGARRQMESWAVRQRRRGGNEFLAM